MVAIFSLAREFFLECCQVHQEGPPIEAQDQQRVPAAYRKLDLMMVMKQEKEGSSVKSDFSAPCVLYEVLMVAMAAVQTRCVVLLVLMAVF